MLFALCGLFFLIPGIIGLVWPDRIQGFVIAHRKTFWFYNPFTSWLQTRYYRWFLRIVGFMAVVCGVIAFAGFIKSLKR
jgi:hypothetical protein